MKIYYFKRKQRLSTFLFVEIILQSGSQRPHFDSQEAFKEFPWTPCEVVRYRDEK